MTQCLSTPSVPVSLPLAVGTATTSSSGRCSHLCVFISLGESLSVDKGPELMLLNLSPEVPIEDHSCHGLVLRTFPVFIF